VDRHVTRGQHHLGEHGSVFCTDADVPWYGDCCLVLSTCYHSCGMDKAICDNAFHRCARGLCDGQSPAERCHGHLHRLWERQIQAADGCDVYLRAQEESCVCMHDEL